MKLRTTERYRSQVCATEIIVVRGSDDDIALTCGGGHPLVPIDQPTMIGAVPDPGLDGGTLVGKRYVDSAERIELLVTRAGAGTLAICGSPMDIAAPRQLPTSD